MIRGMVRRARVMRFMVRGQRILGLGEEVFKGWLRLRRVGSEWYPDWGVAAIGFDVRRWRNGGSSLGIYYSSSSYDSLVRDVVIIEQ